MEKLIGLKELAVNDISLATNQGHWIKNTVDTF